MDSELACGSWDSTVGRTSHFHSASVRVDGRWTGLDCLPSGTVVGLTAPTASVYAVDGAMDYFRHPRAARTGAGDDDGAVMLEDPAAVAAAAGHPAAVKRPRTESAVEAGVTA